MKQLHYPLYAEAPITQYFGANKRVYKRFGLDGHNGLDIGVVEGTPVLAMADGVVRFSGDGFNEILMGAAAGNCLLIASEGVLDGLEEFMCGYAHLSRIYARSGDSVRAGDVIALSGNTGATSGQHLHAELIGVPLELDNGYLGRIDPLPYLSTPLASRKGAPLDTGHTSPAKEISKDTQVSNG